VKTFHFLAGLPRSGSTVLAALLNQHPDVHVSVTSGMGEVMFNTFQAWKKVSKEIDPLKNVLRNIMDSSHCTINKSIIIDENINWSNPASILLMEQLLLRKPKIVVTVREIEDCAASFVRTERPNDLENFLRNSSMLEELKSSYQLLHTGYSFDKSCFLFVEYGNLLSDPQGEIRRVEEFLCLTEFDYDFSNTGIKEPDDSKNVLEHMYQNFVQPRFWRPLTVTTEMVHPLDMQLGLGLIGSFDEGQKIADELSIREPKNHRAAFNRGWYEMRKGHLLDGMILLNRGRIEKVFGNEAPNVPTQIWDGVSTGTALLNLEAGLGDQIHGARFARELKRRGNQVIVACSGPLAMVMRNTEGVDMVIQHEAAFGVVHDFWVPSMTASIPLRWQYRDIDGSPYVRRPDVAKGDKIRIGLRWQGNPQFEHEQHRLFPPQFMFNAVRGLDVEYVSLQRDAGAEQRPSWVKEVDLSHWGATAMAVASCDLVITSCTSVAHLAGAMGVPTWIVVPVLPYYLWAKPGNGTEWYDSVRLFRQKGHGDWASVFSDVKKELRHAYDNGLLDPGQERPSVRRMGLQTIR
jgi:hypothetical protein